MLGEEHTHEHTGVHTYTCVHTCTQALKGPPDPGADAGRRATWPRLRLWVTFRPAGPAGTKHGFSWLIRLEKAQLAGGTPTRDALRAPRPHRREGRTTPPAPPPLPCAPKPGGAGRQTQTPRRVPTGQKKQQLSCDAGGAGSGLRLERQLLPHTPPTPLLPAPDSSPHRPTPPTAPPQMGLLPGSFLMLRR